MDTSVKFCPQCNKNVETIWKFGRERCPECRLGLDEHPIKFTTYIPLGNAEISRRNVIQMVKEGTLSEKDIR